MSSASAERYQPHPAVLLQPHPAVLLAVLCVGTFMTGLDVFIVNVGLHPIGQALGERSLADLSWILNANAIVFARAWLQKPASAAVVCSACAICSASLAMSVLRRSNCTMFGSGLVPASWKR